MRHRVFFASGALAAAAIVACVGSSPETSTSENDAGSGDSGGGSNDGGGGGGDSASDAAADAGTCDLGKAFADPEQLTALNGPEFESAPTLTPDEKEIIFASTRGSEASLPSGDGNNLWAATRDDPNGMFLTPTTTITVMLNAAGLLDSDPVLSRDGLLVIWAQRQSPDAGVEHQLHWSRRGATRTPFPAPGLVTFGDAGTYPGGSYPKSAQLLSDGTLYLAMGTKGAYHVQRAQLVGGDGVYAQPVEQTYFDLTTSVAADSPVVSDDEKTMYLDYVPPGGADKEIAVSTRSSKTDGWGQPMILSGINSGSDDLPRWISPDGCRLYFTSFRSQKSDLYVARRPK